MSSAAPVGYQQAEPTLPRAYPAAARRPLHPLVKDVVATASLTLYSLATAASFARVFYGWEFMATLSLIVIGVHLTSFGLRRLRLHGALAAPATLVAGVWIAAIRLYPQTLQLGFPTPATYEAVRLDLSQVIEQFPTAFAPVPNIGGWALLAAAAAIMVSVVSDAFAFRAGARGEALVPGGVVFIFVAALGSSRLATPITLVLIAAGVIAVATLKWYQDRVNVQSTVGANPFAVPAVAATALCVAAFASWIGPRLPGVDARPILETKGRGGSVTTIASPLVDIRSRLTNQSNIQMFKVQAENPSYWRSTTLPEFDGTTFRLPNRSLDRVDTPAADVGQANTNSQRLQIVSLTGLVLPAAPEPENAAGSRLSGESISILINHETGTLIAPDELRSGDEFQLLSHRPNVTGAELDASTAHVQLDAVYTNLPGDLPEIVASTAAEVTAGATTDYQRARALQDWFRSPLFTYSLDIQSGHNIDAIEEFLQNRVGYCEQFAASYAAMARTLGMASRVAVGYTYGDRGDDGWYTVRGRNAHAWPEVYFDGIGWVAFEPTPGRGAPGTEQYTGVDPQQEEDQGSNETPEGATPVTPAPRPVPVETAPPKPRPTGTVPPSGVASQPTSGGTPVWPIIIVFGLIAIGLAPWLIRRSRRAREERLPVQAQTAQAWNRAQRAVERAGVNGSAAMSASEWIAATRSVLPVATGPMTHLAEVHDLVEYSDPERPTDRVPPSAEVSAWADAVDSFSTNSLNRLDRAKRFFSLH